MPQIKAVAKYKVNDTVNYLLVVTDRNWIACDYFTHAIASTTIKNGGVFYASEQLPK